MDDFVLTCRKRKAPHFEGLHRRKSKRLETKATSSLPPPVNPSTKGGDQEKACSVKVGADVWINILLLCDVKTIKNFGLTCRRNLSVTLIDYIWKIKCQRDFRVDNKWPSTNFRFVYEMFHKAKILSKYKYLFKPASRPRYSLVCWFLLNPSPPNDTLSVITSRQIQKIFGITFDYVLKHHEESKSQHELYLLFPLEWKLAQDLAIKKAGGREEFQEYVLTRCMRAVDMVNQLYHLYKCTTKESIFFNSNKEQIKFLVKSIPRGNTDTIHEFCNFIQEFQEWITFNHMEKFQETSGKQLVKDFLSAVEYALRNKRKIRKEDYNVINRGHLYNQATAYIERTIAQREWKNKNDIDRILSKYKLQNSKINSYLNSYLESGDSKKLDELQEYVMRYMAMIHFVEGKNLAWNNLYLSSNRAIPRKYQKIIRSKIFQYSNSGKKQDYNIFCDSVDSFLLQRQIKDKKCNCQPVPAPNKTHPDMYSIKELSICYYTTYFTKIAVSLFNANKVSYVDNNGFQKSIL